MDKQSYIKHSNETFKTHLEFLVLMITIIGAFVWVRTESRSDYRAIDTKIDTKIDNLTKELHDWNMNFQGRLSILEERRK